MDIINVKTKLSMVMIFVMLTSFSDENMHFNKLYTQ